MQVKIIRVGNSYGVRLPKKYIVSNKLSLGQYIDLPAHQHAIGNVSVVVQQAQEAAEDRRAHTSIEAIATQQRTERQSWQHRQNDAF